MNWLEQECNNSISTRNQRLAAIHSLFRYIQMQAPEYMFQCQQILGIKYKKAEKHQVGYLSEAETKNLLAMPDSETRKGRRDQAMLTLLYDSGARVQELADLCVGDLRLDSPAQVKLTGKGRKTRSVPLMDKTVVWCGELLEVKAADCFFSLRMSGDAFAEAAARINRQNGTFLKHFLTLEKLKPQATLPMAYNQSSLPVLLRPVCSDTLAQ